MRLIDADALVKRYFSDDARIALSYANKIWMRRLINGSPTIDYEHLRHGHWIDRHVTDFVVAEELCGRCEEWSVGWHKRYCPNCGAKMDGKENNDEID